MIETRNMQDPDNAAHATNRTIRTPPSQRIALNRENDYQRRHGHGKGYKRHNHDGPPAGGELAPDHPVLALQVPVVAQQQDQDADGQKGGAERLAQVPQRLGLLRIVRQRRVEPEQLGDGDPDRGEG